MRLIFGTAKNSQYIKCSNSKGLFQSKRNPKLWNKQTNLINRQKNILKQTFAQTEQQVQENKLYQTENEQENLKGSVDESMNGAVNHTWMWKDQYKIRYATAGCGKPVLLIHGFGASIGHYRKIFSELSRDHKVYAVDLLGFGGSDKPNLDYCIDLWRNQILAFMEEFIDQPVVLVGNSIGSTICLMTNTCAKKDQIRGTVFLNIAGGMNNKQNLNDWRVWLAYPIFLLVDFLLKNQSIGPKLFEKFRSKENIANVLKSVYNNQEAVDDALISLIYEPSQEKGAFETFVSIITGPPGPTPMQMINYAQGPFLILWGDSDPFTPIDGPVANFFKEKAEKKNQGEFQFYQLKDTGHCPQDDRPELVLERLLPWLRELEKEQV